MGTYLDKFPKISYDISRNGASAYDLVTDVTFRISMVKSALNDIAAYYVYTITDGDTPEILANKVYRNTEAHWVIMYANDIVDPQYDWPLSYYNFEKYLVSKYGSIANAQTEIHHYEKVVRNVDLSSLDMTEERFVIDYNSQTNGIIHLSSSTGNFLPGETVYQGASYGEATFKATVVSWDSSENKMQLTDSVGQLLRYNTLYSNDTPTEGVVATIDFPAVPYDYYVGLPDEIDASTEAVTINGRSVQRTVFRNAVTIYDYELELNDKKRQIKIIKPEYYGQIINEMEVITNTKQYSYLRRLT